jgi:pimeloyl-ACP methyl ester carboxylesterase
VVLLDWMVLGTPPGFGDALAGLQSPAWVDVRAGLTNRWLDGLAIPSLTEFVASMARYGESHWSRAGREIAAAFAAQPVPLAALEELQPCPTLHVYAQPAAPEVLAAQEEYAAEHPWFSVRRLDARSHFPMFEVPEEMVRTIESFVRSQENDQS